MPSKPKCRHCLTISSSQKMHALGPPKVRNSSRDAMISSALQNHSYCRASLLIVADRGLVSPALSTHENFYEKCASLTNCHRFKLPSPRRHDSRARFSKRRGLGTAIPSNTICFAKGSDKSKHNTANHHTWMLWEPQ